MKRVLPKETTEAMLKYIEEKRPFIAKGKNGKRLFGWHVSNIAFDENPKEISEFKHYCDGNCITSKKICQKVKDYVENDKKTTDIWANCDCLLPLTRPPQSWCYVEVENE